ncbi:MAG: HAD family phosphatase [Anaerolineae bacterium]|nr:HAD family phosphatase [Anaerolineae bacterium]
MTNIRFVATDIDGTLANDRGILTERTQRTLQALVQRGVPVALVTGLNPWPARRYVEQLGHKVTAISLNGVFRIENGDIQEGLFLAPEIIREVAEVMLGNGYTPLVYGEDAVTRYIYPQGQEAQAQESEVSKLITNRPYQPYTEVSTLDELFNVRPAQISTCDTAERGQQLYEVLKPSIADRAYLVYQPTPTHSWVEINHKQARKDTALCKLVQERGYRNAEVIYFGDSLNDMVVFQSFEHCVAMGNARPEIKALAWRIAPTNNEDGVAQILEEVLG